MTDDYGSLKRGGKHAIMAAEDEKWLRDAGAPIRCCDFWPECSHILAWYEEHRKRVAQDTEQETA